MPIIKSQGLSDNNIANRSMGSTPRKFTSMDFAERLAPEILTARGGHGMGIIDITRAIIIWNDRLMELEKYFVFKPGIF